MAKVTTTSNSYNSTTYVGELVIGNFSTRWGTAPSPVMVVNKVRATCSNGDLSVATTGPTFLTNIEREKDNGNIISLEDDS